MSPRRTISSSDGRAVVSYAAARNSAIESASDVRSGRDSGARPSKIAFVIRLEIFLFLISLHAIARGPVRGTAWGNFFSQSFEGTSLQRFDRPATLADHVGNLVDGQIGDDAQHHHIALISGEGVQERERCVVAQAVNYVFFRTGRATRVAIRGPLFALPSARTSAEFVDESSVGD